MKTKVTILGEESKNSELKPIKFHGCLMKNCWSTNYDSFGDGFLDPTTYKEIILITKNYGSRDVFLCIDDEGDNTIMFGKFNDGVVE